MLIVAVIGSPHAGGRTRVAVDAVLQAPSRKARRHGSCELADTAVPDAVAALGEADAAVFGSPTYRADITAQLKGCSTPPRAGWRTSRVTRCAARSARRC